MLGYKKVKTVKNSGIHVSMATKAMERGIEETNKKKKKIDEVKRDRERASHEDRSNHTPFGPAEAGLAVTTAVHARDTMSA